MESPEFPYILCPHTPTTSLIVHILHHLVYLLRSMNDNIITHKIRGDNTLGVVLSVEHPIGFGKCTHHCSIIQNSFTVLKSSVLYPSLMAGYSPWGHKELDTTAWLSMYTQAAAGFLATSAEVHSTLHLLQGQPFFAPGIMWGLRFQLLFFY